MQAPVARVNLLYDVLLRSYWAPKLFTFRILTYFSRIQNVYKVPFLARGIHPRGYIADYFWLFHVVVERPMGAFHHWGFPATSGKGAGDPQNFAYGKCV